MQTVGSLRAFPRLVRFLLCTTRVRLSAADLRMECRHGEAYGG